MNEKLEQFKEDIKRKSVSVIGIGISNRPLIRYLRSLGARVTARDRRSRAELGEIVPELEALGVTLRLGDDYLEELPEEVIFKTPGMRFDEPALCRARAAGASVTSEMEVFFDVCPAKIIAVTGSDGKTTTTTLIHQMLQRSGHKTWLGGNIGNPLLVETERMSPEDWVVLELSSFQLHTMKKSPHIAVMTNISPNHLDMHKDYQEYIDAKKNIMLYQEPGDVLVVNGDNTETARIGGEARGEARVFSRQGQGMVYCKDGTIYRQDTPVLDIADIKIPGMHNVENYMAAIAAVDGLAADDVIRVVAREFGGVPHRIELVRTLDGVRYYNSSIDSSPNRTINTLRVFPEKVILIAGGKDKGIPYDDIGPAIADHVKLLILIGATAGKIAQALEKAPGGEQVEVLRLDSYPAVVEAARAHARPGDVVLLSPASTSFDMFANFEERGNLFKDLVNGLSE